MNKINNNLELFHTCKSCSNHITLQEQNRNGLCEKCNRTPTEPSSKREPRKEDQ